MISDLDFSSCAFLISRLVHLGDQYFDVQREMKSRGLISIDAIPMYHDGLARDKQELELHRKVSLERNKEEFANPFAITFELENREDFKPPYRSLFLDEIRRERELAWNHENDEGAREIWFELDPCRRISLGMGFDEKRKWRMACQDEFFRLRATEIASKLAGPSRRLRLGDEDARLLAFDTLESALSDLGFSQNKKISSKAVRLFSKPLVGDWILCMTLRRSEWGFDGYSFEIGDDGKKRIGPKSADFHLDLRKSNVKGLVNRDLNFLPLNIADMMPLGKHEFSRYTDMDEMVIGILGYVEMYSILGNDIESSLKDALVG